MELLTSKLVRFFESKKENEEDNNGPENAVAESSYIIYNIDVNRYAIDMI